MRAPMTGPVRDLQQPGRTKASTNYFHMALVQMESYAGETRRLRSTFNGARSRCPDSQREIWG